MTRSVAFLFPGQGSQAVGMLDAWGDHPEVLRTLAEASAALGEDLGALIHAGPKEALDLTTHTQPVMLTVAVACWRAWCAEGGPAPQWVAGHSLGEYSALVAAQALTLSEAVPLVRFRAQAMQEAVPVGEGAMAAVLGLPAEQVVRLCEQTARETGEVVAAANFNDAKQTVIAGSAAGVSAAGAALKTAGAKRVLPLPVSAPFHCALMRPAADRLRPRLQALAWQRPQIPVLNNIDVASPTEAADWVDALFRQAFGPVRWTALIEALVAQGVTDFVECGPGKVLAGMVARIVPEARVHTLFDPASLAATRSALA